MLYPSLVRPILFQLDPERVHRWTIRSSHQVSRSSVARACVGGIFDRQYPELAVNLFGLRFRNPIGLAAGFDKHAEIFRLVPFLGFGHMEIGSVSFRPWPGNPSPTLLRLPEDYGLINRPGLNSHGSAVVAQRLEDARFEIPTGLNLVKTADPQIIGDEAVDDYVNVFRRFSAQANFITLNLSCPNTAEGRTFEDPPVFERLMAAINRSPPGPEGRTSPIFVKLSPDLDQAAVDRIIEISHAHGVKGFVIANTTVRRENLKTSADLLRSFGAGGLSGRPIAGYIKAMVQHVVSRVGGRSLVIACGGIGCDPARHPAEEVWEYLNLGASLVQLHTGLIYQGPGLVRRINTELVNILHRHGFDTLQSYFQKRSVI